MCFAMQEVGRDEIRLTDDEALIPVAHFQKVGLVGCFADALTTSTMILCLLSFLAGPPQCVWNTFLVENHRCKNFVCEDFCSALYVAGMCMNTVYKRGILSIPAFIKALCAYTTQPVN